MNAKQVTVGSKGCMHPLTTVPKESLGKAMVYVWGSHKAVGLSHREGCDLAASGGALAKDYPSLIGFDYGCQVGPQGGKVTTYDTAEALKKGIVRQIKVSLSRDGKVIRTVKALTSAKQGQETVKGGFLYIASSEVKAGRIETAKIHDKGSRNANLAFVVALVK